MKMKKVINILLVLLMLGGCAQANAQEGGPQMETVDGPEVVESLGGKDKAEYSEHTILIGVKEGTTKEQVEQAAAEYGFTIKYEYNSFSMYCLESEEAHTAAELDDVIKALMENDFITSGEKDQAIHLTDPVVEQN